MVTTVVENRYEKQRNGLKTASAGSETSMCPERSGEVNSFRSNFLGVDKCRM